MTYAVLAVLMALQIGQGCVQIGQCGQFCGDALLGGRFECLPAEKVRPVVKIAPSQIPQCTAPEHGWDTTCGAMMKFCRLLSSRGHICMEFNATNNGWKCVDKEYRPRPQNLMPLVEPLRPCITKSRTVDESRSNPLFEFDPKVVFAGPHPSRCSVPSWKNHDLVWEDSDGAAPLTCKPDKSGTGFMCKVAEPSFVPALQEKRIVHHKDSTSAPEDIYDEFWTCADKSRVLLSSEDGSGHWCVRF